jgi:hypothetical protein
MRRVKVCVCILASALALGAKAAGASSAPRLELLEGGQLVPPGSAITGYWQLRSFCEGSLSGTMSQNGAATDTIAVQSLEKRYCISTPSLEKDIRAGTISGIKLAKNSRAQIIVSGLEFKVQEHTEYGLGPYLYHTCVYRFRNFGSRFAVGGNAELVGRARVKLVREEESATLYGARCGKSGVFESTLTLRGPGGGILESRVLPD